MCLDQKLEQKRQNLDENCDYSGVVTRTNHATLAFLGIIKLGKKNEAVSLFIIE